MLERLVEPERKDRIRRELGIRASDHAVGVEDIEIVLLLVKLRAFEYREHPLLEYALLAVRHADIEDYFLACVGIGDFN